MTPGRKAELRGRVYGDYGNVREALDALDAAETRITGLEAENNDRVDECALKAARIAKLESALVSISGMYGEMTYYARSAAREALETK